MPTLVCTAATLSPDDRRSHTLRSTVVTSHMRHDRHAASPCVIVCHREGGGGRELFSPAAAGITQKAACRPTGWERRCWWGGVSVLRRGVTFPYVRSERPSAGGLGVGVRYGMVRYEPSGSRLLGNCRLRSTCSEFSFEIPDDIYFGRLHGGCNCKYENPTS